MHDGLRPVRTTTKGAAGAKLRMQQKVGNSVTRHKGQTQRARGRAHLRTRGSSIGPSAKLRIWQNRIVVVFSSTGTTELIVTRRNVVSSAFHPRKSRVTGSANLIKVVEGRHAVARASTWKEEAAPSPAWPSIGNAKLSACGVSLICKSEHLGGQLGTREPQICSVILGSVRHLEDLEEQHW